MSKVVECTKSEVAELEAKVTESHRQLAIAEARRALGRGTALSIATHKENLGVAERLLAHRRLILEGMLIVQELGEFPNVP